MDETPDPTWQYELRLQGHLDRRWIAWFGALSLRNDDDGTTVLQCAVVDQTALHGLLQRVRDVGLPLISLTRVERSRREPLP